MCITGEFSTHIVYSNPKMRFQSFSMLMIAGARNRRGPVRKFPGTGRMAPLTHPGLIDPLRFVSAP